MLVVGVSLLVVGVSVKVVGVSVFVVGVPAVVVGFLRNCALANTVWSTRVLVFE